MSFPLDESQEKIGEGAPFRLAEGRICRRIGAGAYLADDVLSLLPAPLVRAVAKLACRRQTTVYFSGGVVRDWLLGLTPADIDLTVETGALAFARQLADATGACYVPLSPAEGVARLVWSDRRFGDVAQDDASLTPVQFHLDISQFREGTTSIEDDLRRRDFSVNAMAVRLDCVCLSLADGGRVIDPLGGLADLAAGVIRLTHPQALTVDPLRMLRAYRFQALYQWQLEDATHKAISAQTGLIRQVSGERVAAEFDVLFSCRQSYPAIAGMAASGLLVQIFPELAPGVGLSQPSSHHLDVFGHSLEALRQIESICNSPQSFFPDASCLAFETKDDTLARGESGSLSVAYGRDMREYLQSPRQVVRLKYAALLHDLGKTTTYAHKEGRITFYNHDEAGVVLLTGIAGRLHWSNEDARRISQLVKQHMWPFHLLNAKLRTGISPKAVLKLVKAAGDDLIGLFFLVMADSLAGQGIGKPKGMEEGVAALFHEVYQTYQRQLKPILEKPLLTGHDLIHRLGLPPGPLFRNIFDALLEERAMRPEMSKDEALAWAAGYAAQAEYRRMV